MGNEVRVAGVKVGKVTGVGLAHGQTGSYVKVSFRTKGAELGRETGATIRIKTVLGQKYLALLPGGEGTLKEEIPLSRTASPFDVMEAVQGLAGTLDQIDTDQLAQAFTVLSQTFQDTPAAVKASLTGLSRLSQTVAQRDEQLRQLLARAHTVTVLADRDEEFRKLPPTPTCCWPRCTARDAIHHLLTATSGWPTNSAGSSPTTATRSSPRCRSCAPWSVCCNATARGSRRR